MRSSFFEQYFFEIFENQYTATTSTTSSRAKFLKQCQIKTLESGDKQ